MQDKKYLATIVPLGPQARKQIQKGENLDVIRAAVWSETAKKLTPLLGSVCSRFLPATYAWSICNYRPFGVMLGGVTADMEDMLLCYGTPVSVRICRCIKRLIRISRSPALSSVFQSGPQTAL